MSTKSRRQQKKDVIQNIQKTNDSFQNLAARVGLGAQNQNSSSGYALSPISRNRVELEFAYRSSWIIGQAVDVYAEDMTRQGIGIKGDIDPSDIEMLQRVGNKLGIWDALCETEKWARLYGGAIAVLLIDGQKPETPLNFDTVAKGSFKGLFVLDRWQLQPSLTDLITDYGPDLGKPKSYKVIGGTRAFADQEIHHSRVVRINGVDLPYYQMITENGWGQSVLERLWDRLIPYDSATQGTAQLVYKAHLRTYKVKGLRTLIAAGGKAFEGLTKQIDLIRQYQSNEGMTLMDSEDEFESHSYTFAGLSDVMIQFAQQISGAVGIPLVRLLGQSPAGLNSTGESDIRNYYDNIKKDQKKRFSTGVLKIYNCLFRSVFGKEPPDNFDIEFNSLWQLTDEQKASIALNTSTAVNNAFESQIIDRATALKELRQSSHVTGIFTNVTDEDINEAAEELPPLPETTEDPNDADPRQEKE